jgi:hypothetical protein
MPLPLLSLRKGMGLCPLKWKEGLLGPLQGSFLVNQKSDISFSSAHFVVWMSPLKM